ncbi:uncharacterized protein LOC118239146 isoform X1 [Cricetulus griseus]|uniref:uncharacterized protein LOC118239146 isoform X1 n=1 Tax=Cricetulus griseus TaxID=10029 RepID=UPI0015C305BE|nr:uncharacterized protein LOC118239146 isoform X1 [Cricetulus griseus]
MLDRSRLVDPRSHSLVPKHETAGHGGASFKKNATGCLKAPAAVAPVPTGRSNSALPFPPSLKEEKGSALEPWLFVLRHFRNVHECAKAGFRRDIQVYTENNLRNTKDFLTYHIHRAWWRRWTSCSIMSGLMEVGGPTLNVGRTIDGQRPQTELKRRK